MAHDLRDDNAMMAVRRAVQPVNGLGCDVQRRGETKSRIRHRHVIVNRLGQGDDIQSRLDHPQRIFLCAATAETNKRTQIIFFVIFNNDACHVARAPINQHAVRLVTTGAENGAADRENSGKRAFVEFQPPVLHQAAEAIAETNDFHSVKAERGLPHPSDGGI
jgi:hypothetical protein